MSSAGSAVGASCVGRADEVWACAFGAKPPNTATMPKPAATSSARNVPFFMQALPSSDAGVTVLFRTLGHRDSAVASDPETAVRATGLAVRRRPQPRPAQQADLNWAGPCLISPPHFLWMKC